MRESVPSHSPESRAMGASGTTTPHRATQAANLERLADLLIEATQIIQLIQLDVSLDLPLMEPVSARSQGSMLTVRDLAKRLQVNKKTVRRWEASGRLPRAFAIGGVIRWRSEDIDGWLEDRAK